MGDADPGEEGGVGGQGRLESVQLDHFPAAHGH
jgi:hypothetical protein